MQARVQFGCADGRGASRFAICSAIHLHATAASHAVAGHIGDDGGRKMCPPSTPTGLPRPCTTYATCRWIAEHIAHPLRADCKLTINIHTLSRSGQICNLPVLWPVGIATARIPFHCHIDQAVVRDIDVVLVQSPLRLIRNIGFDLPEGPAHCSLRRRSA